MIIIFSNENDHTCKVVMRWLQAFNEPFYASGKSTFSISNVTLNNESQEVQLFIENRVDSIYLNVDDIKAVWYRSDWLRMKEFPYNEKMLSLPKEFQRSLMSYMTNYWHTSRGFLISLFTYKKTLGQDKLGSYNKLYALEIASKCGLKIPASIFATNKSTVLDFLHINKKIITKSVDTGFSFYSDDKSEKSYGQYTSLVEKEMLKDFPDKFLPTLFQEYIEKQFEIRVFYIFNKLYTSAIFSQSNNKTTIDYRRYDYAKLSRIVPYKLPSVIEDMLHSFMDMCKIDTGSIDIIKGKDGSYYFLEVNPVGLFGNHSYFCNYNLYKVVAQYLSTHE